MADHFNPFFVSNFLAFLFGCMINKSSCYIVVDYCQKIIQANGSRICRCRKSISFFVYFVVLERQFLTI
jgi:hypothetical protein